MRARYQEVRGRYAIVFRDRVDLTGRLSNPRVPLCQLADLDPWPAETAGDMGRGTDRPRLGVQRRLKPDEVSKLVAGYRAGATARELAAQFGVHRGTVTAHLEREGVPTRPQGLQAQEVGEAARLYREGWSLARLAKRFAVSTYTVSAALRQAGVRTRPRPGWTDPHDR